MEDRRNLELERRERDGADDQREVAGEEEAQTAAGAEGEEVGDPGKLRGNRPVRAQEDSRTVSHWTARYLDDMIVISLLLEGFHGT
ncbi:MAG: hypothetical protein V4558_03405 [Gemmatimonadota bacterium]